MNPVNLLDKGKPTRDWQTAIPAAVAVAIVLAFIGFEYHLVQNFLKTENNEHWHRAFLLHRGLEAIMLSAVGFLFGREVHRVRAEKAENRALTAESRALYAHAEKERHLEKVSALVNFIETKRETARGAVAEGLPESRTRADWDELSRFASKFQEPPPAQTAPSL